MVVGVVDAVGLNVCIHVGGAGFGGGAVAVAHLGLVAVVDTLGILETLRLGDDLGEIVLDIEGEGASVVLERSAAVLGAGAVRDEVGSGFDERVVEFVAAGFDSVLEVLERCEFVEDVGLSSRLTALALMSA